MDIFLKKFLKIAENKQDFKNKWRIIVVEDVVKTMSKYKIL